MEKAGNNSGSFLFLHGFKVGRLKVPQATVAGSAILVHTILNRETREGGLSESERSYLHESFKYTGGGLALTALVARSLFNAGFAFRIMSANPCPSFKSFNPFHLTSLNIVFFRGCSWSWVGWINRINDGGFLYTARENRPETSVLARE
jgi:hypothetical protein